MPVVCISGAPTEDEMKLTFTRDAIRSCDPFKDDVTIPGAVVAAIRWQASRSVADVCPVGELNFTNEKAKGEI